MLLAALIDSTIVVLLVLTHIIRHGASDSTLVAGVRLGGYTGPVAVGHDLEHY